MVTARIPEVCATRLSTYLRILKTSAGKRVKTISSGALAAKINSNSAQVRRDLAYFGQFGRPGIGYDVEKLKKEITKILGLDRRWRCALVGAGNLGAALFAYRSFYKEGFEIKAIFDNDPAKVGRKWGCRQIEDPSRIPAVVKQRKIEIGIVAVPAEAAQDVTDKLIRSGIKAILNFAPVKLAVPGDVKLRNVDLSIELENLAYFLSKLKNRL